MDEQPKIIVTLGGKVETLRTDYGLRFITYKFLITANYPNGFKFGLLLGKGPELNVISQENMPVRQRWVYAYVTHEENRLGVFILKPF